MVIGDTVGSYKLIQKLGEGGMGVVYLAEHKYIARRAAIKFLLPDLTGSAEVVGRFFAEARAVSLIEHPGIVEVIDCEIRSDGRAYIVMEHLQGESLRAYFERVGKLDGDPAGALAILRQIASALAAAHAQGIVHRDLKPDNVFLHLPTGRSPSDPIVKVLDFGIAKLLGGEGGSKTRTGQLLGTPLYMSPEQCRGARSVDGLSDVYSLGCIMYETFCGRTPFQADGFGDLIIAHVSQAPPEPLDFAPHMAPLVRQTLLACLAKDPRGRPPSMDRLASMLTEAGAPEAIHLRRPIDPGAPLAPLVSSSGARSPLPAAAPPRSATPAMPAPDPIAQTLARSSVVTPASVGEARPSPPKLTTLGEAASQVVDVPPRKNRKRAVIVGVIGAAAVAAVGLVLSLRGPAGPPTPTSQPPTVTAAQPSEPTTANAAPPTHPAAPEMASIELTDQPPGAGVRMDGQVAALPLVVPRGQRSHAVIVDADGFEPLQLSVDGTKDRTISVEMKKKIAFVPAPPPAAEQSAVKSHHRSEHRHGSPTFNGFTDL